MARIRSVHPGLFTDEAFVSLSDAAQVLLIGLWTEADDNGVFAWKPLTLRIRLRGGKDGPIEPLLTELERANCVRAYVVDGHQLGAIRNFARFQHPKFPKSSFTITDDIRSYVGSTSPPTVANVVERGSFPRNGEKTGDQLDPLPHGEERRGEKLRGGKRREEASKAVQPLVPSRKSNLSSFDETSTREEIGGSLPSSAGFSQEGKPASDNGCEQKEPKQHYLLETLHKRRAAE